MAAYVLVDVEVLDPEAYRAYTQVVPETLAQHGGRFLVRGGATECLEGAWAPPRTVLLEFADAARARAWYESPEYQAILPIRLQHARTNFMTILHGVEPPAP